MLKYVYNNTTTPPQKNLGPKKVQHHRSLPLSSQLSIERSISRSRNLGSNPILNCKEEKLNLV